MKIVKKYLILSMVLVAYVCAVSILLRQFYLYQRAYQNLSRLLSHPTVEVDILYEEGE